MTTDYHLSNNHLVNCLPNDSSTPTIKDEENNHSHGHDGKPPRVLSFFSLLAIAYFCVSGGPFGIEQAVSFAPPAYVLLAFVILPFFWSYPLGMVTAELSNACGEDGGASLWADKAFGGEVSVLVGFFSWVSNTVDLSLYPVLFVQYLSGAFIGTKFENDTWGGQLEGCFNCRWFLAFFVIAIVVLINLWGADNVGVLSNFLAVILLLPFVILFGMGVGKVDLHQIFTGDGGFGAYEKVQLGSLITTVVWSFSGYDSIGQLAGEVKNPARNYPMGVMCVLIVTIVTYTLPMLVGMQIDTNWSSWQDGQFSLIAYKEGGVWLGILMSIGGMASSFGLFTCCLCTVSRNLYGLSDRGYLPRILSKLLPRRGTPFVAIIVNAVVVGVLIMLPFNSILSLDMTLYSIVAIFECVTYIKLFIYNPELPRPYRAFKSYWTLPIVVLPIIVSFVLLITAPPTTLWHSSIAVFVGFILMLITYLRRKNDEKQVKHENHQENENTPLIN